MKYYTLKCVPGSVRPEKKNTAENILPEDELKIAALSLKIMEEPLLVGINAKLFTKEE